MTNLQLCIKLSNLCVAALDAGDREETRRLMKLRDDLYLTLTPIDAFTFSMERSCNMSPEQVEALMDCDLPS